MRRVVVIGLVFALSACGADAEQAAAPPKPALSADEQAIRATLERYVQATRANDPHGVCAVTAREVIDRIEALGTTCESFVTKGTREGGPSYTLTTTSVEVDGDRAMTRGKAVESDGPRSGDQPLVRENGRWLLTTKTG
jgi:hypothetical protein